MPTVSTFYETGVLELLCNIAVITVSGNIRHLDFAHGKMGVCNTFFFQSGKFCTMSGKFLRTFFYWQSCKCCLQPEEQ